MPVMLTLCKKCKRNVSKIKKQLNSAPFNILKLKNLRWQKHVNPKEECGREFDKLDPLSIKADSRSPSLVLGQ